MLGKCSEGGREGGRGRGRAIKARRPSVGGGGGTAATAAAAAAAVTKDSPVLVSESGTCGIESTLEFWLLK